MFRAVLTEIRHLWSQVPDGKAIRGFLLVLTLIPLGLAGIRIWWHDGMIDLLDQVLVSVAAVVLISRLYLPFIQVEYKTWMSIALLLGFLMSTVILSLIFYLVITPVGVVMRLTGHDPLIKSFRKGESSYWKAYPARKPDSWKRQF